MTLNEFYSLPSDKQKKFINMVLFNDGRLTFFENSFDGEPKLVKIDWNKVKDKSVFEYYLKKCSDMGYYMEHDEFLQMDDDMKNIWLIRFISLKRTDDYVTNWMIENNVDGIYDELLMIDKDTRNVRNRNSQNSWAENPQQAHDGHRFDRMTPPIDEKDDFSKMSEYEIIRQIDAALDAGDEDRYYELQKALNNKKLNEEILKIKKMML